MKDWIIFACQRSCRLSMQSPNNTKAKANPTLQEMLHDNAAQRP